MFCCMGSKQRSKFNHNSKFFPTVSKRVNNSELEILQLIFHDLAARNQQNLLTIDVFLSFFDLTGLWGAKLFRMFDEDGRKLITREEFLFGISRTIKAPFDDKIKLLYTFFQNDDSEGVHYNDFTKMLYNYSRDELKEILVEDFMVLKDFVPSLSQLDQNSLQRQDKVIEMNFKEPTQEHENSISCFDETYPQFMECDMGTCLSFESNDLSYKINHCNMRTLVKAFAKKIFFNNKVDIRLGKLMYPQFSAWIKSHSKLFQSYFASFKDYLWMSYDKRPLYLDKVEKEFEGIIIQGTEEPREVTVLLVIQALIVCKKSERTKPIKVICLEGLSLQEAADNRYGKGIEVSHREKHYSKCIFYFKNASEQPSWLESFKAHGQEALQSNYITKQVSGTGKFSVVYKCIDKNTAKQYALKVIELQKLSQQALGLIMNESEIMKIIDHPQIVKYKETIKTKTRIYIVTEYIAGEDLYEYVKVRDHLSEYKSAFIIRNIIIAVMHLHNIGIIHRDLKPQNIMVKLKKVDEEKSDKMDDKSEKSGGDQEKTTGDHEKTTGDHEKMIGDHEKMMMDQEKMTEKTTLDAQKIVNIKLIDFGLSNHESQLQKVQNYCVGTPNYLAPEVIQGAKPTFKADNFAIGSILYFLLSGHFPFPARKMEDTLMKTVKGRYSLEGKLWQDVSYEAKSLIKDLMEVDCSKRITLEEALEHEWFHKIEDEYYQSKLKVKNLIQSCNLNDKLTLRCDNKRTSLMAGDKIHEENENQ